jgi:UDP-glucose 4-epimerase
MNPLKDKRILITGGAGLIGSHVALQAARKGAREIVILDNFVRGRLDNLSDAMAAGKITIVHGAIGDRALLGDVSYGIDAVFHLAAIRITQCAEEPRLALEVLVDGTYNVLEAVVQAKIPRLMAASSASIYGLADEFPTTELQHPYNNRTFYGAAKAFNETMLRSFHDMFGLNYVALRFFNVYGPHMDVYGVYTEVLIRWMERIANGQPPLILGDGTQTMDFVDVRDVARACIMAIESDASDEVFNVASGVETSLNELAHVLLKVMGSNLKPEYGPERKVNPVSRRLADTSKAKRMLGFRTEIGLEQGLRDLVAWWQAERNTAKVARV